MQIKADDYSDGLLIMFLLGQAASNSAFSITGIHRIGMKTNSHDSNVCSILRLRVHVQ